MILNLHFKNLYSTEPIAWISAGGHFFLVYITKTNTYTKLNCEMHSIWIIIKQVAAFDAEAKLEIMFIIKIEAKNIKYHYRL